MGAVRVIGYHQGLRSRRSAARFWDGLGADRSGLNDARVSLDILVLAHHLLLPIFALFLFSQRPFYSVAPLVSVSRHVSCYYLAPSLSPGNCHQVSSRLGPIPALPKPSNPNSICLCATTSKPWLPVLQKSRRSVTRRSSSCSTLPRGTPSRRSPRRNCKFLRHPVSVRLIHGATFRYNRNWRYHKEARVWLTKETGQSPLQKDAAFERGTYTFFDPERWEKVKKEALIYYADLEERTLPPSLNAMNLSAMNIAAAMQPNMAQQLPMRG